MGTCSFPGKDLRRITSADLTDTNGFAMVEAEVLEP
jgi:hypothetical protein